MRAIVSKECCKTGNVLRMNSGPVDMVSCKDGRKAVVVHTPGYIVTTDFTPAEAEAFGRHEIVIVPFGADVRLAFVLLQDAPTH